MSSTTGQRQHVRGPLPADRRWIGSGQSEVRDSREAGATATSQALAGREAVLVIVFCSVRHDLIDLIAGVREQAGEAEVIGCTTGGEIGPAGQSDGGVVVAALGGAGLRVETTIATDATGDLRSAGIEAASCVERLGDADHRALLLLSDGVAGDQQEIVRGVHSVLGSGFPLIGGCAGDDLEMKRTYQFHGGLLATESVVAAAIASEAPIGIGWCHGWERIGEPMLVTESHDNRVVTIDDRPALDAYLEMVDAPAAIRNDPTAFPEWALSRPLGLGRRRDGSELVRCVSDADYRTRELTCIAEIPQGALVWAMHGDAGSVLGSTAAACRDATDELEGADPAGLLAFNCVGRKGVLGADRIEQEMEILRRTANGAPIAGFYTYGEFARRSGVNALHNETLAVLAIA